MLGNEVGVVLSAELTPHQSAFCIWTALSLLVGKLYLLQESIPIYIVQRLKALIGIKVWL